MIYFEDPEPSITNTNGIYSPIEQNQRICVVSTTSSSEDDKPPGNLNKRENHAFAPFFLKYTLYMILDEPLKS